MRRNEERYMSGTLAVLVMLFLHLAAGNGSLTPLTGYSVRWETDDTSIVVSLSFDSSKFGGMGIADSGMSGTIIVCIPSLSGASCDTYQGFDFGIMLTGPIATVINSSISGSTAQVSFSVAKVDWGIIFDTAQRFIFANGPFTASGPSQHARNGRIGITLTIDPAPTTMSPPTTADPSTRAPSTEIPSTASTTTTSPSTESPTSAIPSTAVPSTAVPTTAVTSSPTTAAPPLTTAALSTGTPTAAAATSASPTRPTSVSPTSAVPTTAVPTTAVPTTTEAPTPVPTTSALTAAPSTAVVTTLVPPAATSAIPPTSTAAPTTTVPPSTASIDFFDMLSTAALSARASLQAANLTVSLTYPSSSYGAFGVSSSGMIGKIVACCASCSPSYCKLFAGLNYGLLPQSTNTALLLSSTAGGMNSSSTFSIPLSSIGITAGSTIRCIFAYGPVSATGVPQQHGPGANTQAMVTFAMPTTVAPTTAIPSSTLVSQALVTTAQQTTPAPPPPTTAAPAGMSFSLSPVAGLRFLWSPPDSKGFNATLIFSAGRYGAIGQSVAGMGGPIVLCAAAATPTCQLCSGTNYNVACSGTSSSASPVTHSVATAPDGTVTVRFFVPLQTFDSLTQARRYIFATGSFLGGFPQQHDSSGSSAATVNVATGSTASKSRSSLWGWLVGGGIALVWAGIGWVARTRYVSPMPAAGLKMLMLLSLLAGTAAVIIANRASRIDKGDVEPTSLAFGVGAGAVFIFLLLPVCKSAGVAEFIAKTPFDRAMWSHPLLGIVIIALVAVHMVGMWSSRGTSEIAGDFGKLSGLLSWVLMVVMAIFGFLRGVTSYKLFKYTHMLFVLAIGFAIVHYGTLALMLGPGMLLYVVDWVIRYRRLVTAVGPSMKYPAGAGVVLLDIPVTGWMAPQAGAYAFVSVPAISWIPHPFTVAEFDADKRVAKFIIKTGGPWTQELARLAQSTGQQPPVVKVDGPYGSLQTPLERHEVVVLLSGGVGVTPMLRMLQLLAENPIEYPKLGRVYFVWSLRSSALHAVVDAQLSRYAAMLQARGVDTHIELYLTSGQGEVLQEASGDDLFEMLLLPHDVRSERVPHQQPNNPRKIFHRRLQPADLFKSVRRVLKDPLTESVGVYLCAPGPLIDSTSAAAKLELPDAELHTEAFSF